MVNIDNSTLYSKRLKVSQHQNELNTRLAPLPTSHKWNFCTRISCQQLYFLLPRFTDIRWKLCVTDTSGKEYWRSSDCSTLFQSSLCVRWYSLNLPPLSSLKTLQVFSFVPVFFNRSWKPHYERWSQSFIGVKRVFFFNTWLNGHRHPCDSHGGFVTRKLSPFFFTLFYIYLFGNKQESFHWKMS